MEGYLVLGVTRVPVCGAYRFPRLVRADTVLQPSGKRASNPLQQRHIWGKVAVSVLEVSLSCIVRVTGLLVLYVLVLRQL